MIALYRHFTADGELLYVGISKDAMSRLSQHAATSHWAEEICNVSIERFPNRKEAARAEAEAIAAENPRFNRMIPKPRKERVELTPAGIELLKTLALEAPSAAAVFMHLVQQMPPNGRIAVSQKDLANSLGVARKTVLRSLADLCSRGAVSRLDATPGSPQPLVVSPAFCCKAVVKSQLGLDLTPDDDED